MLKKYIYAAVTALFCLCAALSLSMVYALPEGLTGGPALENILNNMRLSLPVWRLPLCALLTLAFWPLHRFNGRYRKAGGLLLEIWALAIAVIWLFGKNFIIDNSIDAIAAGAGQALKSLVYLAGSFWLLRELGLLILGFLDSGLDICPCKLPLSDFFERRPFTAWAAAIGLFSLPTWIICYPGYMNSDAYCQLAYYFGIYEFVAHHPPVHTLMMSWCVRIGQLLGSSNFGLYLFISFQMLCFIAVFAYMLCTMEKLKAPRWLMALSFLTIVFSPFYIPVAANAVKDNLYSYAVLLFTIELVYIFRMDGEYWRSQGHIALLVVSLMFTMLMRNNGKYLLVVCVPLLVLLFFLRGIKRGTVKQALVGSAALILPMLAAMLVQNAVIAHYDIAPGSRREALSLPFQQTARLIFERGEELSEEDMAAIQLVLDYDDLGTEYDPIISDPVKCYYRDDCTMEEFLGYFKVWLRQGLKYPHVYLKATLNQNYPLFFPWYPLDYARTNTESVLHPHISGPLELHDVDVADGLEELMRKGDKLMCRLPVPGLTGGLAFCCLLLLLLCVGAIKRRNWIFLLYALPGLLTVGTIVLGPIVDPRYGFAMTYSMPLLLALYVMKKE